jgi:hypothetical protein
MPSPASPAEHGGHLFLFGDERLRYGAVGLRDPVALRLCEGGLLSLAGDSEMD